MQKPAEQQTKKTSIGGQALIEGIMMRGPEQTAMAVRHVSGEIVLEKWPTGGGQRAAFFRLPFVRGIFNMADSLRFGYKCLMRSAELAGLEDETPAAAVKEELPAEEAAVTAEPAAQEIPAEEPPMQEEPAAEQPAAPAEPDKKEKLLMSVMLVLASLFGVALAVFLFLWLPAFLSGLLGSWLPVFKSWVLRSVVEGVLRILLFVGYMAAVAQMKDIKRVFMYHGAEHKSIFCYEKGLPLTVENVRAQTRFHPRCGTSFMILVLLVGIVVSMFIHIDSPLLRTGVKLLTIPIVVGVGYELIKLAGRKDNRFTRFISAPGLWLQRITTGEPDDSMIECAIAALREVLPEDPDADRW